jgi:hypothetical protein
MTMRVLWGLCLAVAAMMSGIGIELYLDGEGPLRSYPLIVGGIALLPIASAAIDRAKSGASID